jgi:hypothetical protein
MRPNATETPNAHVAFTADGRMLADLLAQTWRAGASTVRT